MKRFLPPTAACRRFLGALAIAAAIAFPSTTILAQNGPGTYWLQSQGLLSWEWDIDHDGDTFTAIQEYSAGTDPFDPLSFLTLDITSLPPDFLLDWDSILGAIYQLFGSPDMVSYTPLLGPIPGDGMNIEVLLTPAEQGGASFFRLNAVAPLDGDRDGLSDIEEAMLGTDPLLSDTDRDGILDGAEILTYLTDPLVARVTGGTIEGNVISDPNGDGDLSDGSPVEGATVYLDLNYNGVHDDGEPALLTKPDGSYRFITLLPGLYHVRQVLPAATRQTLPAAAANANLDTWPDTLIDYTHDPAGFLPGPYGFEANETWPGQQFLINPPVIESVDPALVLKPIGNRDQVPPIGIWDTTEILSIPENGSVTVGFDEIIVDLPGPDLNIVRTVQGASTELTDIFVGPDEFSLTYLTTMDQGVGSNVFPVDLSTFPGVAPPIRVVKLVSKVPPNPAPGPAGGGSDRGAAIAGFQALNFVGPDSSARVVAILGNETVSPVDFGRFFDDRPPSLSLGTDTALLQEGVSSAIRFFAADDVGIVSRSLTANGTPVALNSDGEGSYTPPYPGTVLFEGTATDTAAQVTTRQWLYYVKDAGGNLPFDPNALGDLEGGDGTTIQVFTPGAGSVPTADEDIIATILSTTTPIWSVEYAAIADIDPANLSLPDPDYIPLGSGTSFVNSSPIGVFPTTSLPNGIYFLRITATPSGGGATSYYGHVLGVGVVEADLRPEITITAPAPGANAGLVETITGTITSAHPLTEWYVEYALRSEVDPTNIGSAKPNWTRIADGAAPVAAPAALAAFDTTLVPNDAYIVRVVAWNDLRLGRVEAVDLEVTHQAKLGRHHRVFTDLSIDLAGFPLTLSRVYDSYATDTVGDFGHGWSLELSDPNIRETVPQTGVGIFGATPFRDGTRVYLNSPEDPERRIGFTFKPVFTAASAFGSIYKATFEPDTGVYETLEIPEGDLGFLQVDGEGNMILVFIPLPFNPDRYVLTTKNGNRYTLDQGEGFVEAEDPNGNRLAYSPEEGFAHSSGQALEFMRDGLGRITQVTDPEGGAWSYAYDVDGNLETVTDPDSNVTTYGYLANPAHYLETITDPYGRVGQQFEYDADGRLFAIIDEYGERIEQTWDPGSSTGTMTGRRGNVTQLVYDARGNVTSHTDPDLKTFTFAYADPLNPDKLTSRTDPLGQTTTLEYDANGNLTNIRADGSFFPNYKYTYDAQDRLLTSNFSAGRSTSFTYDASGNVAQSVGEYGLVTDFTHTPEGKVATETINGVADVFSYDPATGDLASRTSPLGPSASFTYDGRGNLTETEDAFGDTFQAATDASGTPVSTTDPNGVMTSLVRNPDGSWTVTNLDGMVNTFAIDAQGLVASQTFPDGFTFAPVYDENRNMTNLTDPNGNSAAFTYDPLDRLASFTDANTNSATYDYDANGNLTEILDRNGKKRSFTYNEFAQVTAERWHGPGPAFPVIREFVYNYTANVLALGRLDSITEGGNTWTFQGGTRQPSKVTVDYAGQSPFEVRYVWSNAASTYPSRITLFDDDDVFEDGRIETEFVGKLPFNFEWTTPDGDGRHVRYFYDAMARLQRLERFDVAFTTSLATMPFATTRFTYDQSYRVDEIRHEDSGGALLFPESLLQYDRTPGGNINSITQPTDTAVFSYDSLGQVTGGTHTNVSYPNESYTYDPAGNRTMSHLFAGTATIGTGNRPSQVGDLALAYDAEGNLATETNTSTGDLREFFYDHRNQLIRVDETPNGMGTTTVAEFEYDYAGRLMNRTVGGTKTWIVHDRTMPAGEFVDGTNVFSATFFYVPNQSDDFFASWRSGLGDRWFLRDNLGSVRGLIDETAAPLAWVDYDSFGNIQGAVPAGFDSIRYASRFYNEGAMLYENRHRSYSPALGRFIQEDPLGYVVGELNLYRYAGNNPLIGTDPFGTNTLNEYANMLEGVVERGKKIQELAECIRDILEGIASVIAGGEGSGGGAACIVSKIPGLLPPAQEVDSPSLLPFDWPDKPPFFPGDWPKDPTTYPILSPPPPFN